jgi:F-type H+-transporting ATPase subunit epsilon
MSGPGAGNPVATIRCDIVSANRQLFSGDVTRCVVCGVAGELGIYPRHAPLMTTLKAGEVRVSTPRDEELTFIIGGGILEVMPHLVTVLADSAVRADDIDEAAALQAKAEAERELLTRVERMDIAEAQAKLAEAVAQLQALERLHRKIKRR